MLSRSLQCLRVRWELTWGMDTRPPARPAAPEGLPRDLPCPALALLRHGLHDHEVPDLVRHRIGDHAPFTEPLVVELEVLSVVNELHEGVVHEVAPPGVVLRDHA